MSRAWPRRVWILSFEFEGFVKAGGLGAAVARHARALSSAGVEVTVLLPSHGKELADSVREGEWNGVRTGVDGGSYPYRIAADARLFDGIKIVVFRGLDPGTKRFLEDAEIYREAAEKTSLYTRGVIHWAREKTPPDVLHSNDWTAALAAMAVKTIYLSGGVNVPWVHTVHLVSSPSFPWHYASEQWSGVPSVYHRVFSHDGTYSTWVSDAWDSLGGNVDAFAALESDLLTSVSRGYLENLLSRWPFIPRQKTDYIHNSTDWTEKEVVDYVSSHFGTSSRKVLRSVLLGEVLKKAERVCGSLEKSSLLAVAHGRLVWQKGYDVLINAVDYMDHSIGVLVMGLSSGDAGHEQYLCQQAEKRYGRVMITWGALPPSLLKAVVYSANVAAMPSRYEPFGISSVEAQALGTPVVATSVPGLAETLKDVYFFDDGGGMLVGFEETPYLGLAITSLAFLTEAIDTGNTSYANKIPLEFIARRFNSLKNIRKSAVTWVETNFREKNTLEHLLRCYEKARRMALERTQGVR
ncbi:MAG: glycogen/starch synthase [Candidatus Caldarchaeum sp.]|nr:glycogen/starch synthase [Candidatus Caldarchaeum sp.]